MDNIGYGSGSHIIPLIVTVLSIDRHVDHTSTSHQLEREKGKYRRSVAGFQNVCGSSDGVKRRDEAGKSQGE